MMQFDSEDKLQEFLAWATGGEREVKLSKACRIDLRTEEYDVEVKPSLTPAALDKAAGQLVRYAPYADGRQQVIAGITPDRFDAALGRQIESLRDGGIEVWLVDQIPFFLKAYTEFLGLDNAAEEATITPDVLPAAMSGPLDISLEAECDSLGAGVCLWLLLAGLALMLAALIWPSSEPYPPPSKTTILHDA